MTLHDIATALRTRCNSAVETDLSFRSRLDQLAAAYREQLLELGIDLKDPATASALGAFALVLLDRANSIAGEGATVVPGVVHVADFQSACLVIATTMGAVSGVAATIGEIHGGRT